MRSHISTAARTAGFTLVELSMVLVILGLLVGGIMAGASLLRGAEIRSVITDVNNYITATKQFREKYGELPGDFSTATSLWGTDSRGCAVDGTSDTTPYTATCNGNGNGKIETYADAGAYEEWRAWQHLSDAKMIDQTLIGVYTTGGPYVGLSVPASRITGAGYSWSYKEWEMGSVTGGDALPNEQVLYFGKYHCCFPKTTYDPALTPGDAQNIDRKIDDANPDKGNVRGMDNGYACKANDASGLRIYNVSASTILCGLIFLTGI